MAVWWTNRSFDASSGVMKPKPFSSLNHLTVPVAIVLLWSLVLRPCGSFYSKGYERWHCCVGLITQPNLCTVAAGEYGWQAAPAGTLKERGALFATGRVSGRLRRRSSGPRVRLRYPQG